MPDYSKDIRDLKGEMIAKDNALFSDRLTLERQLKNGMGEEMLRELHEMKTREQIQPQPGKKRFLMKLKKFIFGN